MRSVQLNIASPSYDRPNQPWVCGLAADGHACPVGPGVNGHCPALADCTPLRDGDRWVCNRSDLRGGVCEVGPTPEGVCGCVQRCTPVRSLRKLRGRFVTAICIATAAALLLMLSGDWRNEMIAPGPLSAPHAQLLRRAGAPPQCAACHSAAADGVFGWTATLVVGHGDRPTQSQLCMNCHEGSIAREFALTAHNVHPDVLARVKQGDTETRRQGEGLQQPVFLSPGLPATADQRLVSPSVACATCHREHHGANFNLAAMDNRACQSCHQARYESFSSDHPEFSRWPYEKRTPIAFDHASHLAKHFREKNQAFDCRKCHIEDGTRAVQLLANYDAACAACHDEKIATSVAQGVPMLVLPTLDVAALRAAGHDIGPWPQAATGDFDGRLPPMMKLLLSADPIAAKAMDVLGPDFEFFDVDVEDRKELAACADLATAIKSLLTELGETGPTAVRRRLVAAVGREVSNGEMNSLVGGLSMDTLQPAALAWLGQAALSGGQETGASNSATGAWFRDDAKLAIRYRPVGHADSILTGWLTLLAGVDADKKLLALAMLKEMSRPTAPGLCASCHSIEKTESGRLTIHWRPGDRTAAPRPFTKFSHGPHVLLPELADCTACHAIDDKSDSSKSYSTWEATSFVSDFRPMAKQECATCHTAKAAGDNCQQCHNYHVRVESLGLRVESLRGIVADNGFSPLKTQHSTHSSPLSKTSSDTRPARR